MLKQSYTVSYTGAMDSKIIFQKARGMFLDDYESEIEKNGILPPSRNKSPLWPPWSVIEYAAMEKDTAKYFLYYSAVKTALQDLGEKKKLGAIKILILGPGRGRLIDYIIDCLIEDDMKGIVHVIEANKVCCEMLKVKYCDVNNVVIHESMAIRDYDETIELLKHEGEDSKIGKLLKEKNVELIVSELFGSFGDNEFMPEILEATMKIFGAKNCVSIPQSYTTYLTPIYSPLLEKFFAQIAAKNQSVESIYILGLPHDTIHLSQSQKLYQRDTCFNSLSELYGQIPFAFKGELRKSSNREKFMPKSKADADTSKNDFDSDHSVNEGFTKSFCQTYFCIPQVTAIGEMTSFASEECSQIDIAIEKSLQKGESESCDDPPVGANGEMTSSECSEDAQMYKGVQKSLKKGQPYDYAEVQASGEITFSECNAGPKMDVGLQIPLVKGQIESYSTDVATNDRIKTSEEEIERDNYADMPSDKGLQEALKTAQSDPGISDITGNPRADEGLQEALNTDTVQSDSDIPDITGNRRADKGLQEALNTVQSDSGIPDITGNRDASFSKLKSNIGDSQMNRGCKEPLKNAQSHSHILKVTTSQETNLERSPCQITGFVGHFTAILYKDIYIDTRPGSTRNTYFWETAFFPLNLDTRKKLGQIFNPAPVRSGRELQKNCQELKVILRRVVKKLQTKKRTADGGVVKACCDPRVPLLQLHYEWSIMQGSDALLGDVHNKDGRHHVLHL